MIRLGYRAPAQRLLLVIGFAVVLTMGAVSLFLVRQSLMATSGVDHSLTVLNTVANLRADLRRAESGQRGYLLTGEAAYLDDYNAALGRVQPELEDLYKLTDDNPLQKDAIDRLRPNAQLGTCAAAAATGEIVLTPDFCADSKWAELRHLPLALGFVGAWSHPIKASDGRVLGTFGTYFRERREPTR